MPDQPLPKSLRKPKVFIDADVLFAGSAASSEHDASLVILRMAEITPLEAFTSWQAVTEVERNLEAKLPQALDAFRVILRRSVCIVPDPGSDELEAYVGLANEMDLPILVATLKTGCPWLVSFNTRLLSPWTSRYHRAATGRIFVPRARPADAPGLSVCHPLNTDRRSHTGRRRQSARTGVDTDRG